MSKKIVIAAGHSNTDSGAVNGADHEAVLVTLYRNALVSCLKDLGITVETDGSGTVNLPLSYSIKLAKDADFALEVHMNGAASKQANGVETIALPKDKLLAQSISKASATAFGFRLRGIDGWIDQSDSARGKLGFVSAGGLILELGFISNPTELAFIKANYWKSARAVAQVIRDHVKGKVAT